MTTAVTWIARWTIAAGVAIAMFTAGAAQAAVVYNQSNPPDTAGLPSGGWGTYAGFSVRLDDAALSTTQTLDASMALTQLVIRHSGTQGGTPAAPSGDWTQALVKIYAAQNAAAASWVGDSTNVVDMSYSGSERNVTFTFDNVELAMNTKYYFYFANTAGDPSTTTPTFTSGRLRVSNNAGHVYSSGNLINNSFGNQDTAYDAVFAATLAQVIPSPAVVGPLMLMAPLLLKTRRR